MQKYLRQFGARKVEAKPWSQHRRQAAGYAGEAILRHLPEDAPDTYLAALAEPRERLRQAIRELLRAELQP